MPSGQIKRGGKRRSNYVSRGFYIEAEPTTLYYSTSILLHIKEFNATRIYEIYLVISNRLEGNNATPGHLNDQLVYSLGEEMQGQPTVKRRVRTGQEDKACSHLAWFPRAPNCRLGAPVTHLLGISGVGLNRCVNSTGTGQCQLATRNVTKRIVLLTQQH